MSYQNKDMKCSNLQNTILDLEEKYFKHITNLICSQNFKDDLLAIEKSIQNNYTSIKKTWDQKNLFKIPAERIMRYHVYNNFDFITGFYPSPISCDIAIKTNDAIINIDVKTIDSNGNKPDIKPLPFEHNQTSFINVNLDGCCEFDGFPIKSNLPTIDPDSGLPILTYIVKFIYSDDGSSFTLYRDSDYYTISIACVPNGELSELFNYDIVSNFKDYKYYSHTSGDYFTPKKILTEDSKPEDFTKCKSTFYDTVESYLDIDSSWIKITGRSKFGYYDPINNVPWFMVRRGKSKKDYVYNLEAVKDGDTARINTDYLEKRYNSNKNEWNGYIKLYLK